MRTYLSPLRVQGPWKVSRLLLRLPQYIKAALGPWMLFLAGPLVGIALGGTWTTSRVMLVALSPPEKVGEFFGLFSLAGRFSAVMGPALTALLLFVLGGLGAAAYRISVGSLLLIMGLGILMLLHVPDVRPETTVEEYAPLMQGERTL